MTKEHEKQLLNLAIEKYGRKAQKIMVMEEMAELQKAICKEIRFLENIFDRSDDKWQEIVKNIVKEVADVNIMLEQVLIMYDEHCTLKEKNIYEKVRQEKLKRLAERIGYKYE